MGSNSSGDPTGTPARLVPFHEAHQQMVDRCAWAKVCAGGLWDVFIAKLEARTFSLDEITREGKRLKNLFGSVESHRKAFMDSVEEYFDASIRDSAERSK